MEDVAFMEWGVRELYQEDGFNAGNVARFILKGDRDYWLKEQNHQASIAKSSFRYVPVRFVRKGGSR